MSINLDEDDDSPPPLSVESLPPRVSPVTCEHCDQKTSSVYEWLVKHKKTCTELQGRVREVAAEALGIGASSVTRALNRHKERLAGLFVKPRLGRKQRIHLGAEQYECIRFTAHTLWKLEGCLSVNRLLQALQEPEKADIVPAMSRSTLLKVMHKLDFAVLRVGLRETMLFEKEDLIRWRKMYFAALQAHVDAGRTIIYIDETWWNFHDALKKNFPLTRVLFFDLFLDLRYFPFDHSLFMCQHRATRADG